MNVTISVPTGKIQCSVPAPKPLVRTVVETRPIVRSVVEPVGIALLFALGYIPEPVKRARQSLTPTLLSRGARPCFAF